VRVLVTGLSTFWGGRLAQVLEARPDVEVIVGVDTREPTVPLERTEFVRADSSYSILSRIVRATQVDTILHTHLIVDSTQSSGRALHEINVIGTMNLLAAAGAAGSPVRKVVVKSSGLIYGSNYQDPYVFREEMARTRGPRTNVERSLLEVEAFLRDFAEDNPHVVVTLLRFTNVLGDDIETPIATMSSETTSKRLSPRPCAFPSYRRYSGSIRVCSSCTKPTSSARSCTRRRTTCRACSTSPATATCRGARSARSSERTVSVCHPC
jgi:nucleoside-diphosphate-sugar epimerase